MMKIIHEHQITDHGVHDPQCFPGDGVANTMWDACSVGVGYSPHEALEDALEMLAQDDWDVQLFDNTLSKEDTVPHGIGERWHYIALKVKEDKGRGQGVNDHLQAMIETVGLESVLKGLCAWAHEQDRQVNTLRTTKIRNVLDLALHTVITNKED